MGVLLLQGMSGALVGAVIFYLLGSLLLRVWIRIDAYQLALAVLQARKRPQLYAVTTVVRAAGSVLIGGTLAALGFGAEGLIIGMLAGNLLPAVGLLVWRARELLPYLEQRGVRERLVHREAPPHAAPQKGASSRLLNGP